MTEIRISYAGYSDGWHGVLKQGKCILADCGHSHANRETGNGNSRTCITQMVAAVRDERTRNELRANAVAAAGQARLRGARVTDDEARAKFDAALAAVSAVVLENDFWVPLPAWEVSRRRSLGWSNPEDPRQRTEAA